MCVVQLVLIWKMSNGGGPKGEGNYRYFTRRRPYPPGEKSREPCISTRFSTCNPTPLYNEKKQASEGSRTLVTSLGKNSRAMSSVIYTAIVSYVLDINTRKRLFCLPCPRSGTKSVPRVVPLFLRGRHERSRLVTTTFTIYSRYKVWYTQERFNKES